MTVLALVSTDGAFAQQSPPKKAGKGAVAGSSGDADSFSWGIALGGLAAIGVIVGVVAASATGAVNSH